MSTPPDAVVFDLDGTLVDTEETWDVVRRGLAEQAGLPWPEEATTAMMGASTPEWSDTLHHLVGVGDSPEHAARLTIDALLDLYHGNQVPALPGAVEAVRRMAEIAPLAVASSSPRVLIEAGLTELGITDLVPVVVSTEEVGRGKPAPDGFLAACERLGADPARSVAVEDSSNGIRSALAAGMKVVVVTHDFHPPSAELLARCLHLDSLEHLHEDAVRSLF